jgi:hypothetical protein
MGIASRLSDTELTAAVKRLARCEREATVVLIAHLAEFDDRRLYLAAGFSSMFTYCTEVLCLSEQAAFHRIQAARAARAFPLVLEMLGEGSLNLATVRLLAPHLTEANHEGLLAAASRKSKRAVEELVAKHFPQPDIASSIRKLVTIKPLAPDRYAIRFTASAGTCEKLRLAQDLLRHAIPDGDTAQIIDRALTALLDDLARKKFAATERPRASRGVALGSRDIPARVKRAVWLRDGGRCAFLSKQGRRCNERGFLQFDHVEPHGVGGEPTVGNVRLLCRGHNAHAAALYYGASSLRKRAGDARHATRSGKIVAIDRPPP